MLIWSHSSYFGPPPARSGALAHMSRAFSGSTIEAVVPA